jgi:hypothetical protein
MGSVIPFQRGHELRARRQRRALIQAAAIDAEDEQRVVLCFDDTIQKGNLALMLTEEVAVANDQGGDAAEVLDFLCRRLFGVGATQVVAIVARRTENTGLLLGTPKGYDQ